MDLNSAAAGSTNVVTPGSDYDVTSSGTGIYNTADSCRFVYTQVTGNFDITVQVASISGGIPQYPQAGLMARNAGGSQPDVAITASPVGGYRFKHRDSAAVSTTQVQTPTSVNAAFPNVYLRLQRVGNLFNSYYSSNGTTWIMLGSVTLSTLPSSTPIYVGLAVASNSTSATTTAQFRGLTGV